MENFIEKAERERKANLKMLAIVGYIIFIPPTLWLAWHFLIKIALHHVFGIDISFNSFWL